MTYDEVVGISPEEYDQNLVNFDANRYAKADDVDLAKIERMLDLRAGILSSENLYLEKYQCSSCGRTLMFSDFVRTSLEDAGHSKSLIVHTLLGSKLVQNKHRPVRCGNCRTMSIRPLNYMGNNYKCCNHGNI